MPHFSEPESGSDLGSLRTTAVTDGDGWVVNGQKRSGAAEEDTVIGESSWLGQILNCPNIEESVSFLINMHSEGIETRPLRQMTGDAEFDEVFFTNVVLPKSLLGPENGGWLSGWIFSQKNEVP